MAKIWHQGESEECKQERKPLNSSALNVQCLCLLSRIANICQSFKKSLSAFRHPTKGRNLKCLGPWKKEYVGQKVIPNKDKYHAVYEIYFFSCLICAYVSTLSGRPKIGSSIPEKKSSEDECMAS